MSSRMTAADLPPSSSVQRAMRSPHIDAMRRPATVEPVKVILSTRGSRTSSSDTSRSAVTTLSTPGGRPISFGDFGHDVRLARRFGRRLQHDGASGDQRRRHLVGDETERGVPRDDRADHADRLAHEQPELAAGGRRGALLPGVSVGEAGVVAEGALARPCRRTWRPCAARPTGAARCRPGRRRAPRCRRPTPRDTCARSACVMRGQGPSSKAVRAAAMARSMSGACASATRRKTCSECESITSMVEPDDGATHSPPMKKRSGLPNDERTSFCTDMRSSCLARAYVEVVRRSRRTGDRARAPLPASRSPERGPRSRGPPGCDGRRHRR